jgi:hypothetical protein
MLLKGSLIKKCFSMHPFRVIDYSANMQLLDRLILKKSLLSELGEFEDLFSLELARVKSHLRNCGLFTNGSWGEELSLGLFQTRKCLVFDLIDCKSDLKTLFARI